MIGSVRGRVIDRSPSGEVLIEVGGLGYRVAVPLRSLPELRPDHDVFVHVHHHVREDAVALFGFITRDERDTFEALIGATGVGPKLALAILSVHTPTDLRRALLDDDQAAFTQVPGVGKKTAQRLMLELRSRLAVPEIELVRDGAPGVRADVRAALAGLGYGADEIRDVMSILGEDSRKDASTEDLLRDALRLLAAERARV